MKGNIIGILVMSLSLGPPLAGQDYEINSTEEVRAVVGENVTLPCQTEPPKDLQSLTVEWKNNESYVHLYRHGQDDHDLQQPQYTNRTILSHEDLIKGNLSLKLLHVQLSDQGNYTCSVVKLSEKEKITRGHVILIVFTVQKQYYAILNGDRSSTRTQRKTVAQASLETAHKLLKEHFVENMEEVVENVEDVVKNVEEVVKNVEEVVENNKKAAVF
ncbi:myelin-oligodendrocyte glycoprotein-like [Myripristis murdjan]|uniref:myelin-oligodendrocyte glycoprotein-like n=1 Tax=Myripristis murdjan TaxID=586833 RepID=UPI00117612FC|nr:myelin-oligodendrocyte glycoprotein-like [Myripristis murdjan]